MKRQTPKSTHTNTLFPYTTRFRSQTLDFSADWSAAHAQPPTLREIAAQLGLRQHSSAQVHVEALIRKGWLARGSQHGSLRLLASAQTAGDDSASNEDRKSTRLNSSH